MDGLLTLETREQARTARLQRMQWADMLLVGFVAFFLCGSYLFCHLYRRCCLERNRRKQRSDKMARVPGATVLVSDMDEPLLGPPDYEQPPLFDRSPPAYDYLPSAPPLSWESERRGSP
ncbi:hypothetical protein BBJ28_00008528 [Nothophytophthora sp. Chile5]|nr:hypothetical protein BBJ28_00008528 [Nothophytophthora sp. Chile5]